MALSKPAGMPVATQCAISAACGLLFGVAFDKSRVFQPDVIVDQMLMNRFIMLKMFLAAVSASSASLAVVSVVAPDKFAKARAKVSGGKKRFSVAALGAGLLGVGMAVGGACPGMVLAQIGSGVGTSAYTLAGCLSGALVHGLLEPTLVRRFASYRDNCAEPTFVDKKALPGVPFAAVAAPLALGCALAVAGLEWLVPWREEALRSLPRALGPAPALGLHHGLAAAAWPPQAGGAIIGALQLPLVLCLGNLLGTSSSYVTVVACALPDKDGREDLKAKRGPANFWQVAFVLGGVAGAAFSAAKAGTFGAVKGLHPALAYAGGAALVLGSRTAGGCTSGHGISGFSMLSAASVVAVPAMFGGGIGTAFAVKGLQALLRR